MKQILSRKGFQSFVGVGVILAHSGLAQAINSSAAPTVSPGVVSVVPPIMPTGPELTISHSNADVSSLIHGFREELFRRSQQDLAFFDSAVNELDSKVNTFAGSLIENIKKISFETTQTGNFQYSIGEIYALVKDFNIQKTAIENRLLALSNYGIPVGGDTFAVPVTEKIKGDLPRLRNLPTLKGVISAYQNLLTEKIKALLAGGEIKFRILDKKGIPSEISVILDSASNSLVLKADNLTKLDDQQRETMKKQIKDLYKQMDGLKEAANHLTDSTVALVLKYIDAFGTSERWRLRSDSKDVRAEGLIENDFEARGNAYRQLENIFWMRSFLRAKFGYQIGTFNVSYEKKPMNWEVFFSKPESYLNFKKGSYVRTEEDLMGVKESFRNMLSVMVDKNTDLGWGIFTGDINPLAVANTFLTSTLMGKTAIAEAGVMVLKLMVADAAEEMILANGGGKSAMKRYYIARWNAGEELHQRSRQRICQYDPPADLAKRAELGCSGQIEEDVINKVASNSWSLSQLWTELTTEINDNMVNLAQAQKLQAEYEALTSNWGGVAKAVQKSTEELY